MHNDMLKVASYQQYDALVNLIITNLNIWQKHICIKIHSTMKLLVWNWLLNITVDITGLILGFAPSQWETLLQSNAIGWAQA